MFELARSHQQKGRQAMLAHLVGQVVAAFQGVGGDFVFVLIFFACAAIYVGAGLGKSNDEVFTHLVSSALRSTARLAFRLCWAIIRLLVRLVWQAVTWVCGLIFGRRRRRRRP
jgi:hypothetical protein